ncbi:MAG: universal stress protein [Proteobacteria bacterium]|nr:universal stress protein [Pseudomonadota bacterium]
MDKGFKRILCPTDFSDYSAQALIKATGLASLFGAKLIVAHIISNPFSSMYHEGSESLRKLSDIVTNAEGMLKKFTEKHISDIPVTMNVKYHENIYGGIIECVEADKVDMIVMATRGVTGPKRVFMGSVTESVVRRAPCSVLVVRP